MERTTYRCHEPSLAV